MALRDGVLYAIVGEEEFRDETLRGNRTDAGWPWRPMTAGYDAKEYPWGFGRTLFAMDLKTRKVLWLDNEEKPIDARAVAMTGNRIIYYCHPNFLACRDAGEGKVLWRNADQDLLEAIGPHHRAQEPSTGFSSQVYMMASDKAVYFAGPQRTRLVAASTENGKLLWQYPHGNFGLVLRDEGLFAMGAPARANCSSRSRARSSPISSVFGAIAPGRPARWTAFSPAGHEHGGTVPHWRGRSEVRADGPDAARLPRRRDRCQRAALLGPLDVRLQPVAGGNHLPGAGGRFRVQRRG